jgi:hypothetical protein
VGEEQAMLSSQKLIDVIEPIVEHEIGRGNYRDLAAKYSLDHGGDRAIFIDVRVDKFSIKNVVEKYSIIRSNINDKIKQMEIDDFIYLNIIWDDAQISNDQNAYKELKRRKNV